MASSIFRSRIRHPAFLKKLAKPEDLVHHFPNDAYVGWSGFTGVGYPKMVPTAVANHVEKNSLQGKLRYNLFVSASAGHDTENRWAQLDMISRRTPHQVGRDISRGINAGRIDFWDKHLSMFPTDLVYGWYTMNKPPREKGGATSTGLLDVTVIEASAITEEGGIVPGACVGASPELVQMAEKVIIEVNTAAPSFEGMHDIVMSDVPPHRKPYMLTEVEERIGKPYIPVDPEKVVGVVEATYPDQTTENTPPDESSKAIAGNIVEFLKHEINHGRLPENLLPLQSGIGNIANAVVAGLDEGGLSNIKVWTEVLQDSFLDLLDNGTVSFAVATSVRLSPQGVGHFLKNRESYLPKLLLRPQEISNSPEIIKRLGCIAMNTPVEVDMYAHANSTNVVGSRMLHGIGGSGDFLRNSKYSIMHTPSSRPTKSDPTGISCIVPFATHVDQTEHDLDVIVTEQGLADVRGLSPRERARVVIGKCAHPDYRAMLTEYLDRAEFECLRKGMGHEPHMLDKAFKMQENFLGRGTMKIDSWE